MNDNTDRALSLLSGIGIGASLMFLLDPGQGRRRRAWIRDKGVTLGVGSRRAANKTWRDLQNRATGLVASAKSALKREDLSDDVLQERIRSRLGRIVSHPGAITVQVSGGRVTLSGLVLASEADKLLEEISHMRGVEEVESRLDIREEGAEVPGLPGGTQHRGGRLELPPRNWKPAIRLLAGAAGGGLALYGFRRPDPVGKLAGMAGLGLLTRGATNREFTLWGARGRRGIDVQKTIHIHAPVERVYRFWSDLENFPHIMSHVREVRNQGGGRSYWKVAGPAGLSAEWHARITQLRENRLLAWESEEHSPLRSAGVVQFEPRQGGTRLHVRLSYQPPGGVMGPAVASLFGKDPQRTMDEDLMRFKSLMESGEASGRWTAVAA